MQISVLSGIYADARADFRTAYPLNMAPVAASTGISAGYLRPVDGLVQNGTAPGVDRGAITWRGACYRVSGTSLVRVSSSGDVTVIGDVGSGGQCTLDYSFDYLGISSGGRLYLYNGTTLRKVTDSDLGVVVDFLWVDGYFLTTDGDYLVVTELNDPFSVNPLKYGSAEADPDPVKGVLKLRNEVYAINRNTIEVFQNVGGENFPFSRIEGAQMQRGSVGTFAACVYLESIAFVGGGRNESPAVWFGSNSSTAKISTREIDLVLQGYSEEALAACVVEARVGGGQQLLYVHLPDRSLVYDGMTTAVLGQPIWYVVASGVGSPRQYSARNMTWCYDRWNVGNPGGSELGYMSDAESGHYGQPVGWEFSTAITYNGGAGAICHALELVCLTGQSAAGASPTVRTSYTNDGRTWSVERPATAGQRGDTLHRVAWLQLGAMRHWRAHRFSGDSNTRLTVARIEAQIEGLGV